MFDVQCLLSFDGLLLVVGRWLVFDVCCVMCVVCCVLRAVCCFACLFVVAC